MPYLIASLGVSPQARLPWKGAQTNPGRISNDQAMGLRVTHEGRKMVLHLVYASGEFGVGFHVQSQQENSFGLFIQ